MTEVRISCLADAIEFSSKFRGVNWFRGQKDLGYKLIPSVFRPVNEGVKEYFNEAKLIQEFVRRCPEAKEKHGNTFELLTYAQHYGLPTRLLDWTENLLVALYFAAEKTPDNKDGRIFILNKDLANGSLEFSSEALLMDILERQCLLDIVKPSYDESLDASESEYQLELFTYSAISEIWEPVDRIRKDENKINELYINDVDLNGSIYSDLSDVVTKSSIDFPIEFINHRNLYGISLSKQKLSEAIFLYRPPILNDRLKAQSGCFTIHPGKYINGLETFSVCNKLERTVSYISSAIIDDESKSRIREELKLCGIRRSTLFPELEHQTSDIKADCID